MRSLVWIVLVTSASAIFFLIGTTLGDGLTTHGALLTATFILGETTGVINVYLIGRDR